MSRLRGAFIDYLQLGQRVVVYEGRAVNKRFTEVNLHFPVATTRFPYFSIKYLQNIDVFSPNRQSRVNEFAGHMFIEHTVPCRIAVSIISGAERHYQSVRESLQLFYRESNVCFVWLTVYRLVLGTKALSHPLYLFFVMQTFYWDDSATFLRCNSACLECAQSLTWAIH